MSGAGSDRTGGSVDALVWLDLALVAVLSLVAAVLGITGATGTLGVVRVLLGFALVFFLPGYAVTAALYPAADHGMSGRAPTDEGSMDRPWGLSGIERLATSVGLSVFLVPLIVLFWNFTPSGITLQRVLGSLAVLVEGAALVAAYRRWRLDPARRFGLPIRSVVREGRATGVNDPPAERALNLLLVMLVLVAVVGVTAAVAVPKEGEQFTELYLLSENPETGELVADDYPSEFVAGEPRPLYIGIGNEEGETVTYTVVVELQEVETTGSEDTVVRETEVDRFTATVAPGSDERDRRQLTLGSELTGESLRLTFLLYRGNPPPDPNDSNAYRDAYLWVEVSTAAVESTLGDRHPPAGRYRADVLRVGG